MMFSRPLSSPNTGQTFIVVHVPDSLMNIEKRLMKKLPGTLRRMAMEGKSFWKSEAGRKLKASRLQYQKAIDFEVVDNLSFYLSLSDPLAFAVEQGSPGYDMKPGFLKNAKPMSRLKRKIPRAVAEGLKHKKSAATMYRLIPLNVNHHINFNPGSAKVVRMVTDMSPAKSWHHPGWKGVHIMDAVVAQLDTVIIPKHMAKLLEETM